MPFGVDGGGFGSAGGGGGPAVLPDHITCLSLQAGTNDRQAITINDSGPFGSILIDQSVPNAGQAITIRGPGSGAGTLLGGIQWRDSTLNLVAQITPAVATVDPFGIPHGAFVFYTQGGVAGIQVAMRILPNPGDAPNLDVAGDIYARGIKLNALQTKDGEIDLSELRGPPGPVGPQGLEGRIGPQGAEGETGPVGPRGQQGPIGIAGPIGPEGLRGRDGKEGQRGPIGQTGDRGEPGKQGIQGEPGIQGVQGERGVKGDKGDVGERGRDGISAHTVHVRAIANLTERVEQLEQEKRENALVIRTLAAELQAIKAMLLRDRRRV